MRILLFLVAGSACACTSAGGEDGPNGGNSPGGASTTSGGASSNAGGSSGAAGGSTASGGASGGSTGEAGNGGGGGTDPGPSTSPFDWVGVIGSGQSLSTGCGTPAFSTTQPFHNLKLLDEGPDPKYPVDGAATAMWSAVPLVEPIREAIAGYAEGDYPNNICPGEGGYGETPHSGMANAMSALWAARGEAGEYVSAHSVVGKGGACLNAINAASLSFSAALSEAQVFKTLAEASGKTYGVGGIIFTHGECDSSIGNMEYGAQLYELWQAYNTELKAITGQTRDVVLFASQQSAMGGGPMGTAAQLWQASVDHPGQIIVTQPKYAWGPYGLHLSAAGYERIGEKYGEVFDAVVNRGIDWKPVSPSHVERAGAVITVDMNVPNPPLVWDTHLAVPHQDVHTAWAEGKGFEIRDDANAEIAIASTEISGEQIIITLASTPADGTELTLGYGLTADADGDGWAGYDVGLHGLLRDSDDFVGVGEEVIEVQATSGSNYFNEVTAGSLASRSSFDIVTGEGVPEDTIISSVGGDLMVLSQPWGGATGTAELTFRHNQYNYCVHFSMPIP